jgi:hypothetical protein
MAVIVHAAVARNYLMLGTLEPNTVIDQDITIDDYAVPFIPPGTQFLGGVDLSGNPGLTTVHRGVCAQELILDDCPSLKTIEDNLVVDCDLSLKNCRALGRIGNGLTVKGNMDMEGCSTDLQLPNHGVVRGSLILPTGFDTARISPYFKTGKLQIAS